jgi:hypothetical protein
MALEEEPTSDQQREADGRPARAATAPRGRHLAPDAGDRRRHAVHPPAQPGGVQHLEVGGEWPGGAVTRAELTATLARAEQAPGQVREWSTPVSLRAARTTRHSRPGRLTLA